MRAAKPNLTLKVQIEFLRHKDVTFERMGEDEAMRSLSREVVPLRYVRVPNAFPQARQRGARR